MNTNRRRRAMRTLPKARVALLAAGLLISALGAASAGNPAEPRLYALRTETGMPHLEENLRYAVRHEQRCMSRNDLSDAFWMLDDVSLQDCELVKAMQDGERADYRLQCSGGHGTSGDAHWRFENETIAGTLNVRLGGKNMTFYQRITGHVVGACP